MTQKECDFLEVTRAVLNPVLDFLEARIFHTCASHIFKTPASRSIFENHRKPIFEIVIFTYCHNASHVFTLYTCSPSECDVKLSARTPGPLCRSGASRSDVGFLVVSLCISCSHSSVLSANIFFNHSRAQSVLHMFIFI